MTRETRSQIPAPSGPTAFGQLPAELRKVTYSGARHPGAGTPECPSSAPDGPTAAVGPAAPGDFTALSDGANCQRYAYAVLGHFGLPMPPLRSAELWADDPAPPTSPPYRPRPPTAPPRPSTTYQHVGVHLGPDQVLHLCREVGRPAVWRYADFAARARYARLLGFKRAVGPEGR
ncbi:cell wall hydrolase [Streptomyces sirii]|uniref:cell wall hydrolase n=1 Tax=Streptomyces sirii TaxID=3127701 RepID=UPI003D35DE6F